MTQINKNDATSFPDLAAYKNDVFKPLIVEIDNSEVREFKGTSKLSGNPYSFKLQTAYLHLPGRKHPKEFEIALNDAEPNYQAGYYLISNQSYEVHDNRLTLRVKLNPLPAPSK